MRRATLVVVCLLLGLLLCRPHASRHSARTRRPSCSTVVRDSKGAPVHNMTHAEVERFEGGDCQTIFAVVGPGRRPLDATSAG